MANEDNSPLRSLASLFSTDINATRIVPQPNVLSQLASYTYNVSVYIMKPSEYTRMMLDKKMNLPGSQLLFSSGGAPLGRTESAGAGGGFNTEGIANVLTNSADSGRSQYFPLDYYIDDIKFTTLMPGKGTRSANTQVNLSFKVTEPNGITFLDNLYAATSNFVGKDQNYASQMYLMVVRFYGYDANGKMVTTSSLTDSSNGRDTTVLLEKYIPFQFTGIKFRIANKSVEYDCQAVVPANNIGTGQARGTIPYNVALSAGTLRELLFGGSVIQTIVNPLQAPAKASAAPKPTLVNGLITALNEYQEQMVSDGIFEVADQYAITFTSPAIGDATMKAPGDTDKNQLPNVPNNNVGQAFDPSRQSSDPNARVANAVAGTSIIQFLDQMLRNSTYIYDQQLQIDTNDGISLPQVKALNPNRPFYWYRIGVQVEPLEYDEKRKDYAYKITYQISPYLVNDVKSEYFPKSAFRGTHKKYFYWFTGENTEVLNYEQDFNYLYYITVNSKQELTNPQLLHREQEKRAFQTRSNESDQGQKDRVNEAGANAADQLYSPADLSRVKLTIMGDPAWITQGEVWAGVAGTYRSDQAFFDDGTINSEIQEPLFEIGFNKPADYNLISGIIDPNASGLGANRLISGESNGPTQNYVYRAVSVTTNLSNGKFTQDLEGVLVTYPKTAIRNNNAQPDDYTLPEEQPSAGVSPPTAGNDPRQQAAQAAQPIVNAAREAVAPTVRTVDRIMRNLNPLNLFGRGNTSAAAPAPAAGAPTSGGQPVGTNTPASGATPRGNGQIIARDP